MWMLTLHSAHESLQSRYTSGSREGKNHAIYLLNHSISWVGSRNLQKYYWISSPKMLKQANKSTLRSQSKTDNWTIHTQTHQLKLEGSLKANLSHHINLFKAKVLKWRYSASVDHNSKVTDTLNVLVLKYTTTVDNPPPLKILPFCVTVLRRVTSFSFSSFLDN